MKGRKTDSGTPDTYARSWQVALVLISLLFGSYVLIKDRLAYRAAEQQVAAHARVIAAPLWNYNLKQSAEYLALACASEKYQTLTIDDSLGTEVYTHASPPLGRVERLLAHLGLIPLVTLSAPVRYADQRIGTLEAHHRTASGLACGLPLFQHRTRKAGSRPTRQNPHRRAGGFEREPPVTDSRASAGAECTAAVRKHLPDHSGQHRCHHLCFGPYHP
ncbi:MAG: hypothetical protein P8010_11330 [Desulfosarcinaceae bacterium]